MQDIKFMIIREKKTVKKVQLISTKFLTTRVKNFESETLFCIILYLIGEETTEYEKSESKNFGCFLVIIKVSLESLEFSESCNFLFLLKTRRNIKSGWTVKFIYS